MFEFALICQIRVHEMAIILRIELNGIQLSLPSTVCIMAVFAASHIKLNYKRLNAHRTQIRNEKKTTKEKRIENPNTE